MTSVRKPFLTIFLLITVESYARAGYVYAQQLIAPSIYTPPLIGSAYSHHAPTQIAQSQSRVVNSNNINNGNFRLLNHLGIGVPVLDHNYLTDLTTSYVVDGRILKQYLVQEDQFDDVLPPNDLGANPILFDDFTNLYDKYARINQEFLQIRSSAGPTTIIRPVTRNHGPIALGSGSLGYIRRANGGVFLGSGSLGYISNQQRVNAVNDARAPKGTAPGPTSFGDSVTPYI